MLYYKFKWEVIISSFSNKYISVGRYQFMGIEDAADRVIAIISYEPDETMSHLTPDFVGYTGLDLKLGSEELASYVQVLPPGPERDYLLEIHKVVELLTGTKWLFQTEMEMTVLGENEDAFQKIKAELDEARKIASQLLEPEVLKETAPKMLKPSFEP